MSNTYTVTVKPMSDAFAAILRFDPDAWVEFESGDEAAETYTINSEYALDALLDAAPGLIAWNDLKVHSYVVVVDNNGFFSEESHKYVRANGGEIRDYRIQNYDIDDQPYFSTFVASAREFDTRKDAEEFCERFYSLYIPEGQFPVDPEAPHYYRSALRIAHCGEWSGR